MTCSPTVIHNSFLKVAHLNQISSNGTYLISNIYREAGKFTLQRIKAVSTTSHKESNCETWKMFFISLQKLFSFSRKSNFRILYIKISWRHRMPKHETRNTFYWITWEVNSLLMKFGQFMSFYKRKKYQKIRQKLRPGN